MKPLLPALLLGVGLSTATVTPAAAYPVDCAILLCLAGGWPASAECAHARAVFIRRITPWPIEPPLQIWNCPMRVSFRGEARPIERLFDIAVRDDACASLSHSRKRPMVAFSSSSDQADVDISDPAFDFVRSIRVFEITYQQRRSSDGDCNSWGYGLHGQLSAIKATTAVVGAASLQFRTPQIFAVPCQTVAAIGTVGLRRVARL